LERRCGDNGGQDNKSKKSGTIQMKLSVIIPVHNGGEGPGLCLEALAAWAAVFFLVLGFASPSVWWGLLPAITAMGMLNAGLYRFFGRQGGVGFAAGAAALHALYLIDSSLTFAVLAAPAWLKKTVGRLVEKSNCGGSYS
jgi:hypothetical protein